MDTRTLWAIILIGLALFLFVAEVFIPSGGLIAILSGLSLVGGIIMLFWINTTLGLIGALVCIVAVPFALAAAMRLWPQTPLFRALTLGSEHDTPEGKSKDAAVPLQDPATLPSKHTTHASNIKVGDEGVSETPLRPVGMCRIQGGREECMTDGQMIPAGKPIRVTYVDGRQIKVRLRT